MRMAMEMRPQRAASRDALCCLRHERSGRNAVPARGLKRLRALAHEVDNLVVACRRAIESAHGETAVGAYRAAWGVLQLSGPFSLAVELGAQVLALERIAPATRAAAHQTQGLALARLGRTDSAIVQFAQAIALFRQLGERRQEGKAIRGLGETLRQLRKIDEAIAHAKQAAALHAADGDQAPVAG